MAVDRKTGSRSGFRVWLLVVIALVGAAFVVPYFILSPLSPGLGVYVFWTLFALVMSAMIFWGVKDWRDPD